MLTAGASLRPVFLLLLLEIGRYFFGKVIKIQVSHSSVLPVCDDQLSGETVKQFKSPGFF